jgi:drug/metabolite transporter (DMT)-like permease
MCHNPGMLGPVLGLSSAAFFGATSIVTRRGVLRASSSYIATVSIFSGFVLSFILALVTGDLFGMHRISWQAYLFWIITGVAHFALGRTWGYRAIQMIGSTRSNVIVSLNPIVSVILAVIILGETITPLLVCGMLFSLSGPLLIAVKEHTLARVPDTDEKPRGKEVTRSTLYRGMLYGLGTAVMWGASAIFIKLGLTSGGPPVAGSLIAYLAASLAIIPSSFLNRVNRKEIFQKDRESFQLALLSGLTSTIAQLLRYLALDVGSVIVVSLMLRTSPLWVLSLAFIFNREVESFSRWVLLGNALLITGTILILMSARG